MSTAALVAETNGHNITTNTTGTIENSDTSPTPTRQLYLLVTKNPLFNAHWAILVPSAANPRKGTKIHATGSLLAGFALEFVRNYELAHETATVAALPLCTVSAEHVVDSLTDAPDGLETRETGPVSLAAGSDGGVVVPGNDDVHALCPIDAIERVALSVPAPGPSLRSASATTGPTRMFKVEVKDCQYWAKQFVRALVRSGICPEDAIAVVDNAPQH